MVLEKLKELVGDQFGLEKDEITPDTSFKDDLGADSLDMVELMMALEEEFEIGEIEEGALAEIETVGDAANFIQNKMM